jgi:dihydroneopterin triphosphate diphosphatase
MPRIVSSIVEIAVFRFAHERPEFLLLQRSADEVLYPGIWQLVTGGLDGDENAAGAALREMKEETGLSPERFWSAPAANVFYDVRNDTMQLTPFFAAQVQPAAAVQLSAEHQAFLWLPCDAALRRLVWPGQRHGLEIVQRYIAGGEQAAGLAAVSLP